MGQLSSVFRHGNQSSEKLGSLLQLSETASGTSWLQTLADCLDPCSLHSTEQPVLTVPGVTEVSRCFS